MNRFKSVATSLSVILVGLTACGGLEQTGAGMEGKGDGVTGAPIEFFACHELTCEPQCQSALQEHDGDPQWDCFRSAQHQGPGCTILCYYDYMPPSSAWTSGSQSYGTLCSTARGECEVARAPINTYCTCADVWPGRIIR